MKKRVLLGALLVGRMALAAEPTPEEVERARTFFNAGAQAYAAGKYADAVRSFEQAYAVAPRPQVLFSLAQAERKEFLDRGDPAVARRAIAHYKAYLDEVPKGGRHDDALEAKTDLEWRVSRLSPQDTAPPQPERRKPRVTVFSPTAGAMASLDDGPPQELPYFADLEPGRHKVRVFGEGYVDAEQEISGDKGIDVPVNLPLREKPAALTVGLTSVADVYLDGRLVARTPLAQPLEVAPGPHVVAIVRNGKNAWSQEIVLARGKAGRVDPRLTTSAQRYVAYGTLGVGIASLIVGGATAIAARAHQDTAEDIEAKRARGNISASELQEHNDAIDLRNDERVTAIVFSSIGAVLTTTGALLYIFDRPPVALMAPRSVEPAPKPQTPLDITAIRPIVGPGLYGAGLSARF